MGAWAVEIEVIPSEILAILSPSTSLITSSIGGGKGDIQFLFAERYIGRFQHCSQDILNNIQCSRDDAVYESEGLQ